jgi:hypothetical protein
MSYGRYPGGASPSYASAQLPGAGGPPGGGYYGQQGPHAPTPQAGYGQPAPYAQSYSPQPGLGPLPPQHAPAPPAAQQAPIQPGTVTYTTSVAPDGSIVYHPFK